MSDILLPPFLFKSRFFFDYFIDMLSVEKGSKRNKTLKVYPWFLSFAKSKWIPLRLKNRG